MVGSDSTTEVAPYRLLNPSIRDQEALVVPDKAPATLQKTPALPPYAFTSRFEGDGEYKDDGSMKAHMKMTVRDDTEVLVRAVARTLAPAEWDKASQYLSYQMGFGGTTSNTRFITGDLAQPVECTYDYTRKKYGDADSHQIVPLFPALGLPSNATATEEPLHDLDIGAPRTEVAVSRIRIPDGWHPDLPDAQHLKTPWVAYEKTYRFKDGEVVAERTVTVLQQKVPKAAWEDYQAFVKKADLGTEHWITLLAASKSGGPKFKKSVTNKDEHGKTTLGSVTPVPASPPDADVASLKRTAAQQLANGDVTATKQTLDRIQAKNPDEVGLFTLYGAVAELNGQLDEAATQYRKEMSSHPDFVMAPLALANVQQRKGDRAEARETLQTAFHNHPEESRIGYQLAGMQTQAELYPAAAKTWQTVIEHHEDDNNARVQLGNALLAAGRTDEAAAAAKAVLDGTDDPGLLNDAGYLLAETGRDLAKAEDASRSSVWKLEEKSRAIALDQVNSGSFRQTNLLIAAWDTLGWILFRKGDLVEAKTYLTASWRNDLHAEVGEHLGQLYEKLGDKAAAVRQYRLAQAAVEGDNTNPAVRIRIRQSLMRLGGVGPKTPEEVQELQSSRTYKIERPADVKGWGTFRLQLSGSVVQDALQSSGDAKLKPLEASIRKRIITDLMPENSWGHLLRTGVVSCSTGKECELVLVPNASLATETQ